MGRVSRGWLLEGRWARGERWGLVVRVSSRRGWVGGAVLIWAVWMPFAWTGALRGSGSGRAASGVAAARAGVGFGPPACRGGGVGLARVAGSILCLRASVDETLEPVRRSMLSMNR